jgi:hypothetical protein
MFATTTIFREILYYIEIQPCENQNKMLGCVFKTVVLVIFLSEEIPLLLGSYVQ